LRLIRQLGCTSPEGEEGVTHTKSRLDGACRSRLWSTRRRLCEPSPPLDVRQTGISGPTRPASFPTPLPVKQTAWKPPPSQHPLDLLSP
jgi:hypothetical protein